MKHSDLRNHFKNEENFSSWLVEEENLAALSRELGMSLSEPRREVRVGNYFIDVNCNDVNNNRNVIIELQITETDHDHFGKLMTYAYNTKTKVAIWICEDAKEEHKNAVRFMSEYGQLEVYIVKVSIIKTSIGSIPSLTCIERPLKSATKVEEISNQKESIVEEISNPDESKEFENPKELFSSKIEQYLNMHDFDSGRISRINDGIVISTDIPNVNLTICLAYRNKNVLINYYLLYKFGVIERTKDLIEACRYNLQEKLGCSVITRTFRSKNFYFGVVLLTPQMDNANYFERYSKVIIDKLKNFISIIEEFNILKYYKLSNKI
jgi:hypothetical protein